MAWTTVETPNARYVLIFSLHYRKAERAPKEFDAVVLERPQPAALEGAANAFLYDNVVKQAVKQGKQVWVTDATPSRRTYLRMGVGGILLTIPLVGEIILRRSARKEKIKRRAFIKKAIAIGLLSPYLPPAMSVLAIRHRKEIKHHKGWEVSAKMYELILGQGVIPARNLLTAEKCESFLAPKLQQELGRKPTIAMVWGPGHYGIRDLLLHPEKRQRLLQKYDLKKFVKADYPKSFQIKLRPGGTIEEVKEFSETLKIKKPKAEQAKPQQKTGMLTRRAFLAQMFRRKRR